MCRRAVKCRFSQSRAVPLVQRPRLCRFEFLIVPFLAVACRKRGRFGKFDAKITFPDYNL